MEIIDQKTVTVDGREFRIELEDEGLGYCVTMFVDGRAWCNEHSFELEEALLIFEHWCGDPFSVQRPNRPGTQLKIEGRVVDGSLVQVELRENDGFSVTVFVDEMPVKTAASFEKKKMEKLFEQSVWMLKSDPSTLMN